jgi:apolipoprotein N-acyltransferase
MWPPHLLENLSPTRRIVNRFVNPAVFGIVCGLVLGASAPIYWVLQVFAAIGGVLAGMEHTSARDGALRGVVGGLIFGVGIMLAHWISGADAKADIGDPEAVLAIVTAVAGAILGAAGGALRGRTEAKQRP